MISQILVDGIIEPCQMNDLAGWADNVLEPLLGSTPIRVFLTYSVPYERLKRAAD